jgi:hypothetical protein
MFLFRRANSANSIRWIIRPYDIGANSIRWIIRPYDMGADGRIARISFAGLFACTILWHDAPSGLGHGAPMGALP